MQRVELTPGRWADLRHVNNSVNERIGYVPDLAQYGRAEQWAIVRGHGAGDCDDYALTKGESLRALGWPLDVLDIATCRLRTGEGHAVLVVRASEGGKPVDYVLDNLTDGIWRWDQKPYDWIEITVGGSLMHWEKIPETAA